MVSVKVGSQYHHSYWRMVNEAFMGRNRLLTEKLSVRLPPGTQSRIDALRCKESRAECLRRILLEALDGIEEPV